MFLNKMKGVSMNLLKVLDANGNPLSFTIKDEEYKGIPLSSSSNDIVSGELLKLALAKADISKFLYPKDMPDNLRKSIINGTLRGMLPAFPKAVIVESGVSIWEKVSGFGTEIDFESPEYWHIRGYVPEKDVNGQFRKDVEKIFTAIEKLSKYGKDAGIIGKNSQLSAYFKGNYKGKKEDGLSHSFPCDEEYKRKFNKKG